MVGSTPEVEWDDVEREWMLALAWYRERLCPLCGGPRDECMAPDADRHYTPMPPVRCHKTTVIRRAQHDRPEIPGSIPDALLWGADYSPPP